tara:strand:+ start:106160 stop:106738 length:579 start_codon:yes stop_codon:yes gene_type:complete
MAGPGITIDKKINTKVINLLGGSGIGKSTTASKLFGEMKDRKYHVELVREYIKEWCWAEREITPFIQSITYGVQLEKESQLYNKLDYVITDSPLILYPIYQKFNYDHEAIKAQVLNDLNVAKDMKVDHINFVLSRTKDFDTKGRFETEEQAMEVDVLVKQFLIENAMDYIEVDVKDSQRVDFILDYLELMNS